MTDPALTPAADGFYHPASEADLVELVRLANREGRQLRVRGGSV
jgi:FAD/FMN-containing dehydrogenase